MNILILGGTGAMGIHVVSILASQGHKIDVTSRSDKIGRANVCYIKGNAHNIKFVKSILSRIKYDAIIDFMTYTTLDFKNRFSLFLDNTKQYFFLSTARVYANSPIISETSALLLDVIKDKEYLSTDEYALCKARQENILRKSGKNNFTIIRPYMTYSENRLQLGVLDKETFLQRALERKTIVVPKDIMSHTVTLTYGYDVAKCITMLIGNPKAFGETFHITTNDTITWSAVLGIYLDVFEKKTGFRPKVKYIDECPQRWNYIGRYQVLYDRLYDRKFTNKKLLSVIGSYNFVEPTEGLAKCISSFLDNPIFTWRDCVIEGTHDFYTKEFTPFSKFNGWHEKLRYIIYRIMPEFWAKMVLNREIKNHKK